MSEIREKYKVNEHLDIKDSTPGRIETMDDRYNSSMKYYPEKGVNAIQGNTTPNYNSTTERDPSGKYQHEPGAKLDSGKILAGILADFSLALEEVSKVGTFGAEKYSRGGWESVENGEQRYKDAMWRHLLKEKREALDPETNLSHEAAVAWNALARLELKLRKEVKDEPELNFGGLTKEQKEMWNKV